MPVGKDGFFEAAKPIPVEGGIKARSRRGSIGEQWWSRRFVDILEEICDPGRLVRGRAYARKGQVLSMSIEPGVVAAQVQGSRPTPYAVSVRIGAYADEIWTVLVEALGARAVYRAQLLAGEMPHEIEQVFAEIGHPLFPEGRLGPGGLAMECSCPDHGVPCKHLSAVLYLLGEAFDDDPFLVLAWRGRTRSALLDAVRGTADDAVAPVAAVDVPFAQRLADFYSPAIPLSRLRSRPPRQEAPVDLLLRAVEAPKLKVRHLPLIDILRSAYRRFDAD
ncbi:putative Zn finger protein [Allocatelliglobosispora scoriae]|uniref:Putative Zn finger protein n=1 Tax=Allocatelliglobosispora scoriae TaxID=643052 RepID=A0A841C1D4_9ACTN|nr:SWIM zinc finger family protein [Allocatelliglobosispora scoriae]MBB5872872.1 putative Zn finger protein [Allocatelliglobosispora scoriae]